MSSDSGPATGEVPGGTSVADDAKARREARKARILGAGSDRLARITKTGRGEEAETLYSSSPSRPLGGGSIQPAGSIDDDEVLNRANIALRGGTGDDGTDDPQEIDISQQQNSNQAFTGNPFAAMIAQQQQQQQQKRDHGNPDMPQDFQSMIKAMQDAMRGGQAGQDGSAGSGQGQASPFPFGQPPSASAQTTTISPEPPGVLDAAFNILRILVFVAFGFALVYGAVVTGHVAPSQSVAETASNKIMDQFEHMPKLHRWARLAYERPAHWEAKYFDVQTFGLPVEGISVFWLFISLEIGLQSMRIMLSRRRPQPPGFLLKVASFIPNANAQLLLRTLASYLPLLDAFVNDLAVVIFTIGCAIMFAAWKTGIDPLSAPSDGTPAAFDTLQQHVAAVVSSGAQHVGQAAREAIASAGSGAGDTGGVVLEGAPL